MDKWEGYKQPTATTVGPGSYTAAPQPTPAPAVSPGGPVAGSNPFGRMFASDAGGLPGLIGMLSGAGTGAEMQQARLGGMQQKGLQAFQKSIENAGGNIQKGAVDFINSPEGINLFSSSQDPAGVMKQWLQLSQKPVDKFSTIGPGSGVLNETTGVVSQGQPTSELQNAHGFLDLSKLDPQQAADFGKAMLGKMSTTTDNKTQKEAAIDWLVANNGMDKVTGEKLKGGVIQVSQPRDVAGNPLGAPVAIDLSTGQVTVIGGANPAAGSQKSATPLPVDPATQQPTRPSADMIFGAGAVGNATATGGGILGNAVPGMGGQTAVGQQSALANIFSKVTGLAQGNTRLAQEFKFLTDMIDKSGWLSNPSDQATALMQLNQVVGNELAHANAVMASSDPRWTGAMKDKVSNDIYGLEDLQNSIPTQEDLQRAYTEAQAGRGSIGQGVKELGTHVKEITKGLKDTAGAAANAASGAEKAVVGAPATSGANPPQTFKTDQEALSAAEKGTLAPGPDGKIHVTVNGVEKTMSPAGAK